jgi:hypothetical protein
MRKLEGQLNSLVDELGYLKEREERFSKTNGTYYPRHIKSASNIP